MPGGWLRDRGTFHRTGPSRTPSREPVAARCTGWPACAASARFHRCTKTPARLLLVPLSRYESRPRAPLRLLQVHVSTSTTTDHPNIALRAVRGRDGCLGSTGSRLPIETAAEAPRGQGSGKTDARHSRSRLLAPETSPQPRSLQAPRVARRHPSPVWSDAARGWRCPRRAPLQGAPADRVAWRRASAKRPGVDQPEVPSVTWRSRANGHASGSRSCQSGAGAFFTIVARSGGHPRSPPMARRLDRRVANHPPSTRRSAPE
jgi:hypothetical protein